MAAGDLSLSITIAAVDAASSVIKNIASSLSSLAGGGVMGAVVTGAVDAAVAIAGIGVSAAQAAGDFEQSMTMLVTSAGESSGKIKEVSDAILQMSVDTGTSTQQLAAAMYTIESSGARGASGLQELQAAAQGAKSENADLSTVVAALTTVLTDYNLSSDKSVSVMNGLITAVSDGRTNLQALAGAMGAVLPMASSLGVAFPQVAAAMSVMTNSGMSARQAAQNLSATMRNLAAPNAVAESAMKNVGLTAQQLKDTLSTQGLAGAIQLIEEHVGKTFPAGSVQSIAAFKAIMGGATGYSVALKLGGEHMAAYEADIKNITAAMQNGSDTVQGFDLVQQNFNFKVDQAKAALNAMMITLGQELLPIFGQVVGWVTSVVMSFTAWESKTHVVETALGAIVNAIQWVINILSNLGSAVSQIWGVIGPTFDQLASSAVKWGQNFMNGFGSGVMSVLGDIVNVVMQVITEIESYLGFASPTRKGPGQNVLKWGRGLVEGMATGMMQAIPTITDAAGSLMQVTMQGMAPNAQQQLAAQAAASPQSTAAQSLTTGLSSSLSSGAGSLKSGTSAIGSQLNTICSTHAQSASKCASTTLTSGLAAKLKSGASVVGDAAHSVGSTLGSVCSAHAQPTSKCAADHLTSGLASKLKAGTKTAKKAAADLGTAVAGAVGEPMQIASHAMDGVSKAAKGVASALQPLGPIATFVKNAWGEVTRIFGEVVAKVKQAGQAMLPGLQSIWRAVQTQLVPAFLNLWNAVKPLGVIIGQIVGAVALAILAFVKWLTSASTLKAMWDGLVAAIKVVITVISNVVNAISGALAPVVQKIVTIFHSQVVPAVQAFWKELQKVDVMKLFSQGAKAVGDGLLSIWHVIQSQLWPALVGLWNAIKPLVAAGAQLALGMFAIEVAMTKWMYTSGALKVIWDILVGTIRVVIAILSTLINVISATLKPVIAQLVTTFQTQLLPSLLMLWKAIQPLLPVLGALAEIIGGILLVALGLIIAALSGVLQALAGLLAGAIQVAGGIVQVFAGFIALIIDNLKVFMDILSGNWKAVPKDLQNMWNDIVMIFSGMGNILMGLVNGLVGFVQGLFDGFINTIIDYFTNLYNALVGHSIIPDIVNGILDWFHKLYDDLVNLLAKVVNYFTAEWTKVRQGVLLVWNAISFIFASAWTTYISKPLTTLMTNLTAWFTKLGTNFSTWATNAMKMFGQSLTNGSQFVTNAITGVGSNIAKLLGFHSPPPTGPLATSDQWMPNMMSMLTTGITTNTPKVTLATTKLANNINTQFRLMDTNVKTSTNNIDNNLLQMNLKTQQSAQGINQSLGTLNGNVTTSTTNINSELAQMNVNTQTNMKGVGTSVQDASKTVQTANQNTQNSMKDVSTCVQDTSQTVKAANEVIAVSTGQSASEVERAANSMKVTFKTTSDTAQATTVVISQSAIDAEKQYGQSANDMKSFSQDLSKGLTEDMFKNSQAFEHMKSAIEEGARGLLEEVQGLGNQIAAILGHTVPQTGPLKDDDKWGGHFIDNIVGGLHAGLPRIMQAANAVATALHSPFSGGTLTANGSFSLRTGSPPSLASSSDASTQPMVIYNVLDGKTISKTVTNYQQKELRIQGIVRGM